MLFVSNKRGSEYAVSDTADSTTEYITALQLKQLVTKGTSVYGVKIKDNKLQVSVYPDLQAIVDKYNSRFTAVGKLPQFRVSVYQDFNPVIITSGLLMLARGGDNSLSVAGKVKMPDFIEAVSHMIFSGENYDAFSYTEFASLVLSQNLRWMKHEMFQRSIIRGDLVLPSSLEEIHGDCFNNCLIDGDLYISDGLKEIGRKAFLRCHITGNLYLPTSIAKIEESAFYNCDVDGQVLFSTPPTEHRDVDVNVAAWTGIECLGYGKGVKEFFKIDRQHKQQPR